jgi:nucleoside-diphosphate-sugar epimerase
VPALIYASSIGAYSAGPKDRPVDENWPTDGIPTSTYARHKAEVERMLDAVERRDPRPRIVRFRPGLVFQREAASEIARYFLGPYIPLSALRRRFIPVIPAFDRLVFQVVHADDLGRAMAMAVTDSSAQGAYNIAADPVLDARRLAATLHAKTVPVPLAALRGAADLAFRGRLIPIDAGWVDMAAAVPVMSTERVKTDLGWQPRITSEQALLDLLAGMSEGRGAPTDPLAPAPSVAGRVAEAVRATVEGGPGSRNP